MSTGWPEDFTYTNCVTTMPPLDADWITQLQRTMAEMERLKPLTQEDELLRFFAKYSFREPLPMTKIPPEWSEPAAVRFLVRY